MLFNNVGFFFDLKQFYFWGSLTQKKKNESCKKTQDSFFNF